ncbi:MAG TPA: asparagine synthase (glutamine-hydrolyzing), partial [Terriglobales bacterium]|nr:asparagine synthase (glutamine-hydrolyzing) [Terriglobales bacterium]
MCGIAGFTHVAKRLPSGVLTSALQSIAHRGPDHQGQFTSSYVSLGATRLRIIDLEAGDQPLKSPDGDVVLVFNGEIFNHQELRSELQQAGFHFQTHCDTEVALNAYLHWGDSCFSRFRGMFAIAAWTQSRRRLVLARDRMGIKPLYYCVHDGEIFFGSELKCIFAHPKVSRNICLDGLNAFLSVNYVPGPFTLVEGIVKLMPGHMLEWHAGAVHVENFVLGDGCQSAPANIEEACEELDHLLSSAVREQLVADTALGIWLSGGLDSSTVLHYAAANSSRPLKTFSITFRGASGDESEHIQRASRYYGTDHAEFDLNTDVDLESAIEDLAYYSDEPSADAGALPTWFLSQMTRESATVALSGEGSDELFAGYLTYQADRYSAPLRWLPKFVRRAALAGARQLSAQDGRISFEYKLKRFLEGSLLSPELAHIFWNGTNSERDRERLYVFSEDLNSWIKEMKGAGLQRFLDFDQRYYLADDILYKVDRMSMAHSLEVRPPFLDPRIVDFSRRIPEDFKLHGSTSKYVLRKLMAGKLPPAVLHRSKMGFDIPVHDWFRGALRPLLLETLNRKAVEATGLF